MLGWGLTSLYAARPSSRLGHREAADIGIADGRIAQLGGTMTGTKELAADGLLAIPGGIDAHTHLVHQGLAERVEFPVWVDDFWSGSRAAIAADITTIGNMTYPMSDEEGTEETPVAAITRSDADIALWDPGHRRTIDGAHMQSRSGYSVYDGWQVQAGPGSSSAAAR